MKTFTVQFYGYTHCPQFATLTEAQAHLKEIVSEELQSAKRKSREATKHKLGKDNYSITLGRDRQSALWSSHYIA